MKKVLIIATIGLVLVSGLFAYDGKTSASFAYGHERGENYLGISSNSTGFFGGNIGYYAGADALFNLKAILDWNISVLVGPSYRYSFNDAKVNLIAAAGLSAEGTPDAFACGVGANIGADWHITSHFGLGTGVKVGNNFVSVPFDGSGIVMNSSFYVTPYIGVEFYY